MYLSKIDEIYHWMQRVVSALQNQLEGKHISKKSCMLAKWTQWVKQIEEKKNSMSSWVVIWLSDIWDYLLSKPAMDMKKSKRANNPKQ